MQLLIVDEQELFGEALRASLAVTGEHEVLGVAATLEDAVLAAGARPFDVAVVVLPAAAASLGPEAARERRLPATTVRGGGDAAPNRAAATALAPLTPRERELFHPLVLGEPNQAIATRLGLSVKTVETHRARILRKLGVHDVANLVRFAIRHRLV